MSVAAPRSSAPTPVAEKSAPSSPHTQGSSHPNLRKHVLDSDCSVLSGHESGGEPSSPSPSAKKQKVAKTSFNHTRNPDARDYMNGRMLDLAHMTKEVYAAKMHYQRLRLQELEMMKVIMGNELDETQGYMSQMEMQIGEIRQDLVLSGRVVSGSDAIGQWARLTILPGFSRDSAPNCGSDFSHSNLNTSRSYSLPA